MLPPESLSGVATFVAAARARSFTQAAERLGVSKSAVGKAIQRLEQRLGVELFHRTTRKVTLTADGEAYFAACAAALDDIGAAEDALAARAERPAGRLRINMPAAYGRRIVLPILQDIGKAHPGLQYTIRFADHLVDLVEEGVDLAIRFGHPGDGSGIVARRLTTQRWLVCAAPDYLARRGTPLSPDALRDHDCIVGQRKGQPLSWRFRVRGEAIRVQPPATHELDDGDAMNALTLAGFGLCQMPEFLFRPYIASGHLVPVLAAFTPDGVDVNAVWPKVAHLRPKVRHVVDTLVALGKAGRLD